MNTVTPSRLLLCGQIGQLDKLSKELKKADIHRAMEIMAYAERTIPFVKTHFEVAFAGKDVQFLRDMFAKAERRINRNIK